MTGAPGAPTPQPNPYAQPNPHAQPNPYAPPQQQPDVRPFRVPEAVGDLRRALALFIDLGLAALLGAGELAGPFTEDTTGLAGTLAAMAGAALAVSFVNQVLLTRLFGASAGKFLFGARVVREEDARRPGIVRLVQRWMVGLTWGAVQLVLMPFGLEEDAEDKCGVRIVRARDLRRTGAR